MRAHGIDFSKWAPDWIMPKGAPIDFAIQRVGFGKHRDERYINHSQRMNQVDIRMAYFYYSSAVPWKEQVDFCLGLVNDNPYTTYHGLWWDYEEKYNVLSPRTARETTESVRYLRMGFDGKVGVYCNRDAYVTYLQNYVDKDYLNTIPLWLAAPVKDVSQVRANQHPPWCFKRGKWPFRYDVCLDRPESLWKLWQYSWIGDPNELGIIGKKEVDVDVFNGTAAEMRAWLKIGVEPPPPPPEPDLRAYRNEVLDEAINCLGKLKTAE